MAAPRQEISHEHNAKLSAWNTYKRMVEGDHDIDCKIDGIGSMGLKSEFVKKG